MANVFLVLRWDDSRLAHGKKDIQRCSAFDIWSSRIEISNEIGIVRRTLPEVVDAERDGSVTYRQRFVGSFSQPLNLRDFHFDRHVFRLHLVSVGIRADEIMFVLKKEWVVKGHW
ncbi:MAG: hypothetical protein K8F52_09280 [Candidatus Scalindua rubra]|uniref:Uncharacterized protein n=1 Tax=Candidatus Scalindua brodae TaxID=237368 RepID=A0A0B0EEL9_9BACT|nr:MAG: hypothetical protein SCABRO_03754 [Candidatus Scalindua brodae]MBZ0108850.1 hypothetical protein [Candidatus Scalindua rubra]